MHILLMYEVATKQLDIKNQYKDTNNSKTKENYTKVENFSQNYVQKGIWLPPTPKSHNVLTDSPGDTTNNKTQNKEH